MSDWSKWKKKTKKIIDEVDIRWITREGFHTIIDERIPPKSKEEVYANRYCKNYVDKKYVDLAMSGQVAERDYVTTRLRDYVAVS